MSITDVSIPKNVRTTALCTFALSVGFQDTTRAPLSIAAPPDELLPFQGTAVAIDDYHLLSCAHLFEFDRAIRNYPIDNLKYMFVPFSILVNDLVSGFDTNIRSWWIRST